MVWVAAVVVVAAVGVLDASLLDDCWGCFCLVMEKRVGSIPFQEVLEVMLVVSIVPLFEVDLT